MNEPTHTPEDGATHTDGPSVFVGSKALMDALHETYSEHIGMVETEGPDGPYMWCSCGWRSDYLGDQPIGRNPNPGSAYAIHLTNAQHAAAVAALQPIVRRIVPGEKAFFDEVSALAREHAECSGCPTPWWLEGVLGRYTRDGVEGQ